MNVIETYTSFTPLYAVLASLAAVPLILLSTRYHNLRETWTILAAAAKFLLVFSLVPNVLLGKSAVIVIMELSPGICFSLKADAFGVFFALIASGLWILTSIYSIGYVRGLNEKKQTRYFTSFAICLSATIGIAFAANLLTFFVFYEMLTIATYPLVIHKETPEAISAGRKYLTFTLSAGVILLAAIGWLYMRTGNIEFFPGGIFDSSITLTNLDKILFILFICGVGVKAAIIPLHSWLPTAMVAPTPVSALLHAVAVVKSGVFGIVRIVGFIFGPYFMHQTGMDQLLTIIACITIITASLIAFAQNNLKRLLAYSTISHLSYIVLGTALLSPASFTGGLLHLANHAFLKITLFFCAGAIYVTAHQENISDMAGIGRAMPITMAAFTLGAFGLVGIPPLNGFIDKWYLGLGALDASKPLVLIVLLVSGLLNAGYFFPIIYRSFFSASPKYTQYKEASPLLLIPLILTAVFSLALGLFPNLLLHLYDVATIVSHNVIGAVIK